jgi:Type IV pilus assembly protein PilM
MRRSLGLEIGPAGVRWVELEEERGRSAVRSSGTAEAAGVGALAAGETLRALAAERRWRGREVVVSLPRSAVTLRWLFLPAAAREETAGMVELEAAQSLPFPMEEAAWDFMSFPAPDGRQEALVVAARRPLVLELRRQIEAAGLRVGSVTVDALATTALYRELLPEAEGVAVFLHLDEGTATVSCVQAGQLLLSRSVTPEQLNAETLAVEVRRTLVAGMMAGVPARPGGGANPYTPLPAGGPGDPAGAPPAISLPSAVWLTGPGAYEALAEELGAILGLGTVESGRSSRGEPCVRPGRTQGSPLPPAAAGPSAPLSLPVHASLPRAGLSGGEELSPAQDTALGLALLGLRPASERLDLARVVRVETERRATGPARRLPFLVGAGAAAVGVALLVMFGPGAGDRDLAAAASRAQADARQMASQRDQLETRVRLLSTAVTPAHSYLDVLNDVSGQVGPDVWLTQYTYDRGRPIVIRGTARTNEAVARLVEGLRRSPHLERVALGSVTRAELDRASKLSVVQFMITGSLKGDQPLEVRRSRSRSARTERQEP